MVQAVSRDNPSAGRVPGRGQRRLLTAVALLAVGCAVLPAGPSGAAGEMTAGAADSGSVGGSEPAAGPGQPASRLPELNWPAAAAPGAAAPMSAQTSAVAGLVAGYAERVEAAEQQRLAAVRTWQLAKAPLRPPPPPAEKAELATEPGHVSGDGLPPVISRVPTDDKVVFLTIDDGAEKDPDLLKMAQELDIPYTGFLTDYVSRENYGYFREMHAQGAGIQNHSISHPELPKLSYAKQRAEICDQQDILEKEIGERPVMFRPPYGAYNADTLKAAADCGIEVVPLWAEEAFADRMEWSRADQKFHPGDIILTHFRGEDQWEGSMPDMLRLVVETATEQGFALARLEDYI